MKGIKNLKYTLCALGLALPIALTGCGHNELKELKYIEKHSEYEKDDIYFNDYSEVMDTLNNIVGVTCYSYNEEIKTIDIDSSICEEDFVIVLMCLNSGYCDNLFQLKIDSVNLSEMSENTLQLFKSALVSINNLEILQLINTNVYDISFLSDAQFKESLILLTLQANNITNVDSLSDFSSLETLFLDCNNIENIDSLGSLENISTLYISNNHISDISIFLNNCPNLCYLNVSNNYITDFTVGEQLQSIGINIFGLSVETQQTEQNKSRNLS